MTSASRKRFQASLLLWFESHKRNMPWRATADPYKIWISETMLQQTQILTATRYYARFIERFPTVRDLANARPQTVMKFWEGLGYYSRARNLHAAAKQVVRRFDGRVPDTLECLLSLPGIGRYTAGAVLSIAYGRAVPVLDGNVVRVLARVFRITENARNAGTLKRMWTLAESLVPARNTRQHNEALMELGATVCRPRHPECPVCPVRSLCEAHRHSAEEELPILPVRKPLPHVHVTAGVIRKKDAFLITLRPAKGLLGGLWEFPGGKRENGESLAACLEREIREELGIRVTVGRRLVSVNHAYSHFRITLHAFECKYTGGRIRLHGCDDARWITAHDLTRYAFPGADRKIIALLKSKRTGGFA